MSEEIEDKTPLFHALDYISLSLVIVLSVMIGLYYSIYKKDTTTEGYLFGHRKLKVVPVALSITVSIMSCMALISQPAEIYLVGSDYWYFPIIALISETILYHFYAPVLYNSKCITLHEYLEKRFSRSIRTVCSVIYTINTVLVMPVLLCISSLALCQVSGINFPLITIVSGLITTFYTTIGGIRAVVWTDALQAMFMGLGIIILSVRGTIDAGGFIAVWRINYENDRIVPPNYSLDFLERYNIWEWIFGATFHQIGYRGMNQGTVQRYLSVPTLKLAKRCIAVSAAVTAVYLTIANYIGMLVFAVFKDCDPLSSHKISTADQLVPLLVTYTLRNHPGLSGLVIAAFMSATLSTVSTQLNSAAAIVLNDFYKPFFKEIVSEKEASIVMISTVLFLGVATTFLVFIVNEMGSITQAFFTFTGLINGSLVGIFLIGMYLPRIKSQPVLIGSLCGLMFVTWISTGAQLARWSGLLPVKTKPVFVHGCEGNITISNSTTTSAEKVFVLYRIPSFWHTAIGCFITILVSWILSLFVENNDVSTMDPSLYSSFIHKDMRVKNEEINETEMSLINCKRDE